MERATMIASEEEYRIAKSEAEKFERSIAARRKPEPEPEPRCPSQRSRRDGRCILRRSTA